MNKKYGAERPQTIENTAPRATLNYGVYEVSEDELQMLWQEQRGAMGDESGSIDQWFREEHKYGYNELLIPLGQMTYAGIVNAIIRDKYTQADMEAITNNMAAVNAVFMQTLVTGGIIEATKYLKESINDENTAKFKEMQEWRTMAKQIAKEIIKV